MTSLAQVLRPLDPSISQPLYQQLQRAIREAIENRVLGPDDALPAERQIAADLSVSRITVRKAIDGLVEEGLLVRRQGSGNFVASRIEKNCKLTSFSEDMRSRGRAKAPGSSAPRAGDPEALSLRLSPGAPVYRFHRLRYADDAPMCLSTRRSRRCLSSLDAGRRVSAMKRSGRRQPPGARALQQLRRCCSERAGEAAARRRRCGPAGRAPRIPFAMAGRSNSANPISAVIPTTSSPSSTRPANSGDPASTHMFREAAEAGEAVRAQLERTRTEVMDLGARLRSLAPRAVVTCARGSSDHAATVAKYLIETRLGVLTASAAPSIASLYGARQDLRGCLFVVISQSGRSDLSRHARGREAGASWSRSERGDSPLAALAQTIPSVPARGAWPPPSRTSLRSPPWCTRRVEHRPAADGRAHPPPPPRAAWTSTGGRCRLVPATSSCSRAWAGGRAGSRAQCKDLRPARQASAKCAMAPGTAGKLSRAAARWMREPLQDGALADLVERGVECGRGRTPRGPILPTIDSHTAISALFARAIRLANTLAMARGFDPDRPVLRVTETT